MEAGVKSNCVSTECQNVEHDDYHDRWRTNYINYQNIMRLGNETDSVRVAGWKPSTFRCDLLAKWIKRKRTDYTGSEGEEQVSV